MWIVYESTLENGHLIYENLRVWVFKRDKNAGNELCILVWSLGMQLQRRLQSPHHFQSRSTDGHKDSMCGSKIQIYPHDIVYSQELAQYIWVSLSIGFTLTRGRKFQKH